MNVFRFRGLWRQAVASPTPEDRVTGPWEGFWHSEPSGHRGRLRCVVRGVGDGRLDAAFHAVFWKVMRMTYEPTLRCRPLEGDGYEIEGAWKLGWWMGEFRYEGTITPDAFEARYRSKGDHGVFEMRRPG